MRDYEYDLSQVLHARFRVAETAAELKTMRQASPNTYLPQDVRGAELGYDFWCSRLRVKEDILRKFHPDQPRVPAGNPDGGQWTDGGGGVGSSRPNSIDPINTGSTSARPRAIPVNSTTASGSLTQGGSWIGATLRPFIKKAAILAGPLANFGSPKLRGTAIHTFLKAEIDRVRNPNLRTEVSFLKSAYATLLESDELNLPEGSMNLPGQVRYGKKFTVRIDVHDKASDNLVCVYDAKTGRYDITPPRMDEIAKAVARRYGDGIQFFVIGMKPFE